MIKDCRVYWGSHGCKKRRGHRGNHDCGCCECPFGMHRMLHDYYGCVGKYPYYFGKKTKFYGEDSNANK